MKFHYYAHSTFATTENNTTLLFDPYLTGNPAIENISIDDVHCDYILVTHGHADHVTDLVNLAKRLDVPVVCSWEIHQWLHNQGVTNTHPMNTGGTKDFGDFKVKCVVAQHSSGLPDGNYGGAPMGFIIWQGGTCYYYAGDTSLTLDMQLIPSWATLDFAVLPIGDNFTMGPEDAARAAVMVETKKVIGVHYDTFGFIEIDHAASKSIFADKGVELILAETNSMLTL